ncbi:MAG: TspO/MBR family protein [Hyphomonadaceae bacterium]|nr:TspO/MBR family protein [Hyphomonadaceae bacterium]
MTSPQATRGRAVLVAAGAALAVAALGATVTDIGPWYRALDKPDWQPPDAAFGIVWTILYAMAAASAVIAWRAASQPSTREWIIGLFALNGFLNVLWSLLFFRLRRPDWALLEVGALWASIAMLMVFLWRTSRLSSLLLAPYLAWVTIAAALNAAVVALNAPFA